MRPEAKASGYLIVAGTSGKQVPRYARNDNKKNNGNCKSNSKRKSNHKRKGKS